MHAVLLLVIGAAVCLAYVSFNLPSKRAGVDNSEPGAGWPLF